MNTHKNIHDCIVAIESRFAVDTWSIAGVHLWPHIRIKLYYHLLEVVDGTTNDQGGFQQQQSLYRFQFIKDAVGDYLYYIKNSSKKDKKKIAFVSVKMHRVLHEGKPFNRFFDTMIKEHNLKNDCLTIEMQGVPYGCFNSKNILDAERFIAGYKVQSKACQFFMPNNYIKEEESLVGYTDFVNFMQEQDWFSNRLNFEIDLLIAWSKKIKDLSKVFSRLFKNRSIKRLIALSYYGFDYMAAAMLAANDLGIETIDFQHGPQTNVHMAYSSWTKLPEGGYNTMPKAYWNWDQTSSENIKSWWKKPNGSKIIGQPWLAFNQNAQNGKKGLVSSDFLYSLQIFNQSNLDYFFPAGLLELIRTEEYHWRFRIHPRNSTSVDLIHNFLKRENIPRAVYHIELPALVPLYNSLNSCIVHITNYSGCVIESVLMNKLTIIIDETGYLFYKSYIQRNLVHFVDKNDIDFFSKVKYVYTLTGSDEGLTLLPVYNPLKDL